MSKLSIVGLSGNITQPSKTRSLVQTALGQATEQVEASATLYEIADFGDDLGRARRLASCHPKRRKRSHGSWRQMR